jgi:hypothetical protein
MSTDKATSSAIVELIPEELEEEQGELFAPPSTAAGEAKLPVLARQERKPGRPKGSRNKRTERTVSMLLARHRDPRVVLLEIAEANTADLAGLLGCSMLEAMQERRIAAAAVLPFVAQRMPIAIDVTKRSAIHMHLSMGRPGSQAPGGVGLSMQLAKRVGDPVTALVAEHIAEVVNDAVGE